MRFQRIQEKYTRQEAFIGSIKVALLDLVENRARVHDNAQRPVQALVDGDEDKFLGEDVDILLGSP